MNIFQSVWTLKSGWTSLLDSALPLANLVLVFGSREALSKGQWYFEIEQAFPDAHIISSSTAGEIIGDEVLDDSISATAIAFEHTQVRSASVQIDEQEDLVNAGRSLAKKLYAENLSLVFVLSDGQNVNGSALAEGLNTEFKGKVPVTGGLAGDGAVFEQTLVGLNAQAEPRIIAAIGFYGDRLLVGHGSMGGWDTFGPSREVTRSENNVLFELDGSSALDLYKEYLGDRAAELPSSALLFPLSLRVEGSQEELVRTVLNVNEADKSMIFAGDIPEGTQVQLMKANFDRIIAGAETAAFRSLPALNDFKPELAILISCVGRKLILGQRIEEEVENVKEVLGENVTITGFYSYGEISPLSTSTGCSLHNQTMTITTLAEQ